MQFFSSFIFLAKDFILFTFWFYLFFIFRNCSGFTVKLRGKYRGFSFTPGSPHIASPIIHVPNRWDICCSWCNMSALHVTLTCQHHVISCHSWCCPFYGSDKCVMTCMHHYSIIQNNSLPWNPLCSTYSSLPQSPGHQWSVYCLYSFAFSTLSYCWD